jgi:hypothetical protein
MRPGGNTVEPDALGRKLECGVTGQCDGRRLLRGVGGVGNREN